jgi:HK97 family phage prohead protease
MKLLDAHRETAAWWKKRLLINDHALKTWWRIELRDTEQEIRNWWRLELRAIAGKIFGKIPYNSFSENLGGFYEKLKPGVFSSSLKSDRDIYFLWSHDAKVPLGSTASGTLKLTDTSTGLKFGLIPPDTQAGRDALTSVRRGDIKGVSFGFEVKEESWVKINNQDVRLVCDAKLYELSAVVWPAYKETKLSARALR